MSLFVVFVAPFYKPNVRQFVEPLAELDGVTLALLSQDSEECFPESVRSKVIFQQVHDATSIEHLTVAAHYLTDRHQKIHRLLAVNEQIQLPVARVRERLGIGGMSPETILNFRDKARMKECFRAVGVPCARHCAAQSPEQVRAFVKEVGYPVCVKPVDGAAAQGTVRVASPEVLEQILQASRPSPDRPLQVEEFVVGEEHSFETFSLGGHHLWHSVTHYDPSPLSVIENPWVQWRIISPFEIGGDRYDDIKQAGRTALTCLGMGTGLTHLEWFRKPDGSVVIGEVAARPPGAEIVTIMNRAHDMDLYKIWSELMVYEQLRDIPARKYAAGAAFLRGLGGGRVRAVRGLEILEELGDMVTDSRIPQVGQPAANSYEGEGFVLVRHQETQKVRETLQRIVETVRVELI